VTECAVNGDAPHRREDARLLSQPLLAERITVEYEPLPAVTRAQEALKPDAPLLTGAVSDNLCIDWVWDQIAEVADSLKPHRMP
jgi:CO/xanthine dehydrogenase Mo-binding subunit